MERRGTTKTGWYMAEHVRLSQAARIGVAIKRTLLALIPTMAAALLVPNEVHATHAMGGDITYECLGNNQYRINMSFFRDCNGVAAPTSCSNGDLRFNVRSVQCGANFTACFVFQGMEVVTPICATAIDRCNSSQGQYGVQRHRYSAVINLSQWANCGTDWVIDWSLCCRNNAITSLQNPGSRDLYLSATLDNTVQPCNSSPRFLNDPVPFGCVGQPMVYNHGVSDMEGDSLVFALAPARGTNGSLIPYAAGYSYTQPVITSGGANAVQIDPQTGTISFTPSIQQFAVVTVLVREFRNGVQIGSYTRDLQFAIIPCANNNPTLSGINGTNTFTYEVCAGTNFCFSVNSSDVDAGQTVTMTWNNAIPGATFTTSGSPHPTGTFCWTPTVADIGQHIFTVSATDNACALVGSAVRGYLINVTPPNTPANAGPDQSVCGLSTTMAAVLPHPQVSAQWTVVSGSGTFASPSSPTTTVTGLSPGTNVFRWNLDFGTCGTSFDEVTVIAYDPAHPAANAGPDQSLCLPTNSTTLAANAATAPAVGTWTVISGSGTFANPNAPNTVVTGLAPGTNVFRWTIDNGACTPPTSSQVSIHVYSDTQPAANAGPDQQLCSPNTTATLAGNQPIAPATGQWTVVSGSGTFANPNLRNTTVSGLSIGVNTFEWTITNGPCQPPTTSDQVSITVYDPASPNANAGPDQEVCGTTATLVGNAPLAPAAGQWTLVSGAGTITDPTNPTSTVTGLGIGANVFQWTLNNGPCANGTTTSQVTITRFDPNVPAANAGPDQDLCSVGGTGLASTTLAATPAPAPATGQWTIVSGSGTFTNPNSPTTTVTNIPVGTHVYQWTVNNGPCTPPTSSDQVVIRVFDRNAPVAAAGPDQQVCAPVTSVTLAANAATAPAVGTWTVVSGAGTFADPNSPTTTVTGMAIGTNVYQWTIANGPCPNSGSSDQVSIVLFDPATSTAQAGPDQELCGSSSTTLAGNAVAAPAQGTWSVVSGSATIANVSNPTTSVSNLPFGITVLRWTVSNGPCGTSSDDVTIARFDPGNPVANAGPDQEICIPVVANQVTMAASSVTAPAVGTWSIVSGSGMITDPNSPTTTITDLGVGVNVFRWTVDNGPCPTGITSDDVIVRVFDNSLPPADAGPDQSLCTLDGTAMMAGSPVSSPATGQWTLVSGSATIVDPSDPNTMITGLGVGQHIFQWTVNNGPCTQGTTTDQMSIFVYDPNNPPADAGADQSICTTEGNTITLEGSPVIFPATGLWTVTGGPATIQDPTAPITTVTDLEVGNYTFTWTVNNGACPDPVSSSTSIVIVADGFAQEAIAGPDQSVCGTGSTVTMAANTPTGVATGSWSVDQGTAVFADPTSPTTTVSGLSIGVNVLRWSIDNAACGITSDLVSIFVYDPNNPVAGAGPDQSLCTPTTSTTMAGSPLTNPAVGQWTLVSGTGTIANPGSPTTTVSGLSVGENVFQWQVNNGACPNPITTDLVSIFVFASTAEEANAGPDQEICTPVNTVTMTANAPVGSAVGTWTLLNGGGTILDPNDPNTTITDLPVGANVFQWSIDNGSCGISSDVVTIYVFNGSDPVANAGPDQELCTPTSTTTLAGSAVTFPATGTWTLVSGSGTIVDPSSPTTAVTGLAIGENIFAWTVDNGPCANGITTDQVSIFVFDENNPVANAGPDQELCTPASSTTLAGSPVTFPAIGTWSVVSGNAIIADVNDPNTTVSGLGVGEVVLQWAVDNGPCANGITTDQVSIFVFDENNPAANAGPDQELCTPASSTTLAGSPVTFPATGTWSVVSGNAIIADVNDPNTTVSGLGVGEVVLQWTVDNGPCDGGITVDQMTILVFDENNPVADAGPDQELCTPTTIATMSGSAVTFPATGQWTLVSGQGNITDPSSPTTTITGLGLGANVFEWTVSNGPCANGVTSDQVTILLFDGGAVQPTAGPDQFLCLPTTSTTMAASPVTAPGIGTWTLVSGQGTIVDPNDPNTAITGLGVGENIFEWTADNGPCGAGSGADQVSIFVYSDENPVANAGPDQELCTPNITSTTLAGSPVIFPAVGTWTIVSGSGTIVDPNDPNTLVLDLEIGVTVLQWTVDNGPCATGITTDQVTISVFDENNPVANSGPDQELCTPTTSTQLSGSPVTYPAVGTWTVLTGTATITDPNDPNTTVTGMQPGEIVLQWTVDNGPCATGVTQDVVSIFLYDANSPVANAGPDQELCTSTGTTISTTLQGSLPVAPAIGTWQILMGSGTIVDPNDPNTTVTDLEVGQTVIQWTVTNGPCDDPVTMDEVTILVYDENNPAADAGPNQQVCTPVTSATMAGSSLIFPATGTWTLVSGQGTIVDPNDPNTEITDLGIGPNVFEWTVYNGTCANSITTDQVTIVLFDAQAPPADAGPDQEICAPNDEVTLAGNPPVGSAVGTWAFVQGGGTIISPNDPNTVVTDLMVGENILSWTIESGDCVTTTDNVSIFVFNPENPVAHAGMDQELCVPEDSVYMAGSILLPPATGTWTLVSGQGTPVDPNDPNTLITGLGIGVNVFEWTVYNGPCPNGTTTSQVTITLYSDTTAAADAGPDIEICLPLNEVNLQGVQPPPPAEGTWTLIAGQGTIVDPHDPNTLVTNLGQGINTFVWTLEWDPCPNNGILSDTMTVYVFDPTAPFADAGPDQQLCTPDTTTHLAGNTPMVPGVGTWTVIQGNATVVDPNDPNSEVTGLEVGVHVFVWTIYNGICAFGPPTTDTVQIAVFDHTAPLAATGDDVSWCTPTNSAVLSANDPVFPGTGYWTSLSGTGTFADPTDPNTAVFGLGVGQHDFQWTIDNGACGISTAGMSVFIYDGESDPANAGPDQDLCLPTTSTGLQGNAPVFPATGEWTLVSGTGTFADPSNPTTTVSGLSVGTNVFRWTIHNGPCGDTEDEVTITLYDNEQVSANAGPDQQLCTPVQSTTLQGSPVSAPATGMWTIVSGSATITDPTSPTTTVTDLVVGTLVLQWSVDNGPCTNGNTSDQVTIEVFDHTAPEAAAGPDQSFCTPITDAVTMFASGPVPPGSGFWALVSGSGSITDPTSPFTAVTDLALGENVFEWTIDNGACGTTSDQMSMFVYDGSLEAADAGDYQEFCQHLFTETYLDATPVDDLLASGTWSLLAGTAVIENPSDPHTRVTGLSLGTNAFIWTVDNGECGVTRDTVVVVLKDCLTLTIPDAFSPNGDGTNDTYVIHNIEYYPENKLVVFNRWGNKVLERAPYNNDWDGTSQFGAVFGEKLPESTYYFVLDPGGDKEPITGYIYLRR